MLKVKAAKSLVSLTLAFHLTGCISLPYKFGANLNAENIEPVTSGADQAGASTPPKAEYEISRGEPYALLDGLGHYLISLPTKLLIWNWSIENHDISPETEKAISDYMRANNLSKVKVRLNEYAPFDEFSRLLDNEEVGAGWRYTFGAITWLVYTVFPGRLFGGDHYNPYTNSISLFSDHRAVALHEGGHAKDLAAKEWKGSYAALSIIPLAPLWFEAEASTDALSYVEHHRTDGVAEAADWERDAYKVLYPAYGTYIGGSVVSLLPIDPAYALIFVIPGHIVGRIKASNVPDAETQKQATP
jgi:hypothetical protein